MINLCNNSVIFMIFHKFWTPAIWLFFCTITSGYDPRGSPGDEDKLINQPMFLPSQQNYTVNHLDMAVLSCVVENLGTKTVIWRKLPDDNPLTVGKMTYIADPRIQTHHVVFQNKWNLHIRNATKADSGTYECQISTRSRNLRQLFFLNVLDKTHSIPIRSGITLTGNLHVEIGETLKLSCNATQLMSPLEDILWFKDGVEIKGSTSRIQIYKNLSLKERTIRSDLFIERVEMGDSGYYLCRTTDDLTTHKHVQILNTTGNKDKRGTVKNKDFVYAPEGRQGKNAANNIHAEVVLFVEVFFLFLMNIFS